jgi:hypothetical protein
MNPELSTWLHRGPRKVLSWAGLGLSPCPAATLPCLEGLNCDMRNGYERDGTFVRSAGTYGVDVSCGWMAGWLARLAGLAGWLVGGGWLYCILVRCSRPRGGRAVDFMLCYMISLLLTTAIYLPGEGPLGWVG